MRQALLYFFVILGVMLLLGGVGVSPVYAQNEEKPEPLALDKTEWGIQLTCTAADGKQTVSTDKLIFKDDMFNSEGFEAKDYEPSNYTLSALEDGATVFETMQTKGEDKVFWKGEIRDKGIRGIISVHPEKGASVDYSFVGGLDKGELGETNKAKRARQKAEEETKRAAERAAREAELSAQEAARKAEELANMTPEERAAAMAAEQAEQTNTTEQSFGDKLKGIMNRIKGSAQE